MQPTALGIARSLMIRWPLQVSSRFQSASYAVLQGFALPSDQVGRLGFQTIIGGFFALSKLKSASDNNEG